MEFPESYDVASWLNKPHTIARIFGSVDSAAETTSVPLVVRS
jgi:hypothetical protein